MEKLIISVQSLSLGMGPVRIRHSSHHFGWQSSHSVDLAGWQGKMASIEICIPWRNAYKPHWARSAGSHYDSLGSTQAAKKKKKMHVGRKKKKKCTRFAAASLKKDCAAACVYFFYFLQPACIFFFFCSPRAFSCHPRAAEQVITRPRRPWLSTVNGADKLPEFCI